MRSILPAQTHVGPISFDGLHARLTVDDAYMGNIKVADDIGIRFQEIRSCEGDQRKGFEQLICQLAQREKNREAGECRRVDGAGGDGGVESYRLLKDGTEHGYQAKYFLATKDIDWSQIDKSVKAALEQHPKLTAYTIAIACDLTDRSGKLGKGKTGWEHWETHKSKWRGWARAKGMTVEFLPWTKSELLDRLITNTENRGLVLIWFNACLFDDTWFQNLFERAKVDLGERFQPEDHVEVMLARAFDGLARSPAYLSFLSEWFDNIPGLGDLSAALSELNAPLEEEFRHLQDQCGELRRISESIHGFEARPFPIADWQRAIQSASDAISPIREWLYSQDSDGNDAIRSATHAALRCLGEIATHLDKTPIHLGANNPHEIRTEADLRRVLVVVGEAGSGKSHLFADAVAKSLNNRAPAILLLGQHFPGQDIRREFLSYLDLGQHDFDKVLQALNAAGEAAQMRLIILIDALNEAHCLRVWPDQLAGFVSDVLRHEWLAIGISLRPEYENRLILEIVRKNAAHVTCRGIQSPEEQEQAAVQYFVKRGITRPAVPWLAPEFSNFLFLKTCCDALQERGIHEFPRGLRGSRQILKFYPDSVDSKLHRRFPSVDIPKSAMTNSIRCIAGSMAAAQVGHVNLKLATKICEAEFGCRGSNAKISWFSVLISEGLFRRDHIFHDDPDSFAHAEDVYRFTYQHFSDHLIVQALLEKVDDIGEAFRTDGSLRFFVENDGVSIWSSLWSALAVQIPEKFAGKELFDVLPNEIDRSTNWYTLSEAFEHSILWRSNAAFSDRTLELFNTLLEEWRDPRFDILIRLATLREHPWNAELLDRNLQRRPLPERDAFWTVPINRVTDDDRHPVWELIRWSLTANLEPADTETLRLAAITLTWMFTSSSCPLRDTATKALTAIFINRLQLIPEVLERFQDVDDLYVMERICAAILGTITRGRVPEDDIKRSAQAVYRAIFARETPHLNINLRDCARAIIDYAVWRGCLDDGIDIKKCQPPYRSPWPLSDVTTEEIERTAEVSGGKQILLTSCTWVDFVQYEIEPVVHRLSCIPLDQPRPLNAEERETTFLAELASWDRQKQEAFAQLKSAVGERAASLRMETTTEENFSITFSYSEEAIECVNACQAQFTTILNSSERRTYEQLMLPVLMPVQIPSDDRFVPKFDAEFAKRWITKRAYDYGWNNKLFSHDRGQYDSRERPKVESIWRKYQWLALSEFVARLTDNVWAIGRWPERAMIYDHPANWLVRDIEPSFLTDPKPPNECRWWQAISLKLEPIQNSLLPTWPFQEKPPNTPDWMDVVAPDGTPWLLLYGFFNVREDWMRNSLGLIPFRRETFVRVSTILIEAHAIEAAISLLKRRRLADPTGHDTIDWTDGPFLCEYPWRNTWWADSSPYEDGYTRNLSGIRYIRPVARHRWESPLDSSLQHGASVCIPNPWMGDKMGLRPNLDSVGEFVAETNGQAVFLDPTAGTSDASAALINKERFFKFLKEEGLECLWIVAGERNARPSGDPSDYACRSFASVYRWTGKKWIGNKWHYDTERRSSQ